jgi:hypothetical protein
MTCRATQASVAALHLLQWCLVYVNTLMLQRVLADPAWRVRMTEADMLHYVQPLVRKVTAKEDRGSRHR